MNFLFSFFPFLQLFLNLADKGFQSQDVPPGVSKNEASTESNMLLPTQSESTCDM